MQPLQQPIVKDLVFIGGGHSHAIALKMFGIKPLPGIRITLISDVSHTPYSGMLPGHIAGFYNYDEAHIDLRSLAKFARARLHLDRAVGLDLTNNRVICANSSPIDFDILSIDIGSTPATISVPGASELAIPAKPVPQFLHHWNQILEQTSQSTQNPVRLGIVGGGAGGVELALAIQARLHDLHNLEIHLFQRGAEIMPQHNRYVRRKLQAIFSRRSIQLHLGETVSALEKLPEKRSDKSPPAIQEKLDKEILVICNSGLTVECDRVFWVTNASAPKWLAESGLSTDSAGFIQVQDTLQSLSHPHIFASGDIATNPRHPRPKAGVFAVRQGKPLFDNLQRFFLGKPLKPYKPQKQLLALIGTGTGEAIASRGSIGLGPYRLLWYWKDWIDRKFMAKFSDLQ
ncbi:MAG: FAD-dependent oxidoreductase [Oscillatoria sp. SIO1A7]|nr:FAD-dependent oxidoreductase [Oscillatoria sp. SIO1A7]